MAVASTGALISNGGNISNSIGQPAVPIRILIINTGITQVGADISAINTSIHRGATLAFSAPQTVVSNVNAGGTLSVGNNVTPLTIIGNLNLPIFSTLAVDMANTTTTGSITTTAATTISPDSSVFVSNPGAATGTIINTLKMAVEEEDCKSSLSRVQVYYRLLLHKWMEINSCSL